MTAPDSSTMALGFRVLGHGIRRQPRVFIVSTVGSVLFGALTVADAWVLGWATDNAVVPALRTGQARPEMLWAVVAMFVGVAILRAGAIIARRLGAGIMQYRLQAEDRRAVTRRYLELPLEWHQRHPTGQLLSNANSDVEALWAPIAALPMAVGTVVTMVVAIAQMLLADVALAVIGLVVFPAVIAANLLYQRVSSPLFTRAQHLRAQLSEVAHESFDGALVVKTLGREVEETERFAATADELRATNTAAGRARAAFEPVVAGLPNVGVLLVLALGAARVSSGQSAAGDVVTVAYLLMIVAFPIRAIGWLLGEFPRSVVGFRRVRAVLDATGSTVFGARSLDDHEGGATVRVDGLRYAYPGVGQPVLTDLDLDLAAGRGIALVGATASGKSTLVSLLSRLMDPVAGAVRLDGVDLRDLRHGALADSVAIVPQTGFLFDDTVRGNVTLGVDADDQRIWAALRTAQADGFVASLPDGLDSRLGERGTSLSGGQRQRICLARALVRDPRLLILDDATSAVDPEVEARILAGLRGSSPPTMVVVASRLATIALVDEVLFLQGGRIVDRGPHSDLLARNADYARLVTAYQTTTPPESPHE